MIEDSEQILYRVTIDGDTINVPQITSILTKYALPAGFVNGSQAELTFKCRCCVEDFLLNYDAADDETVAITILNGVNELNLQILQQSDPVEFWFNSDGPDEFYVKFADDADAYAFMSDYNSAIDDNIEETDQPN